MGRHETRDLVRIALPCDPGAPKLGRDALRDVPELAGVLDDLLVVVSELVTNAVMHSGCAPQEMITLRVSIEGDRFRVAVHDPGHSDVGPAFQARPPAAGGRGLRVVARLAVHWGTERADGRLVWADLGNAPPR